MNLFRTELRWRAVVLCVLFAVLHKASKEVAGEESPSKAAIIYDVCLHAHALLVW